MDSTFPSLDLASPATSPARAARAAVMAAWGSDLPLRRRRWRLGRSTSTTLTRSAWRWRVSPAPVGPRPFDADQLDRAEVAQPSEQQLGAALGGGEALDAEEGSSVVQRRSYMHVALCIDAAGDAPCQSGHCHPFVELGWGDTAPSGTTDKTATGLYRQAPMRSLRPTGGCRVGDRARPDGSNERQSQRTSAGLLESDLAWAPTHTLTNPFTEVVDHSAATSILVDASAAPRAGLFHCHRPQRPSQIHPPWTASVHCASWVPEFKMAQPVHFGGVGCQLMPPIRKSKAPITKPMVKRRTRFLIPVRSRRSRLSRCGGTDEHGKIVSSSSDMSKITRGPRTALGRMYRSIASTGPFAHQRACCASYHGFATTSRNS